MNAKTLYAVIGAVIGLALVRAFWLDQIELIAWEIFWSEFGNSRNIKLSKVLQSQTFLKCTAGIVVGTVAGLLVYNNKT